MAPLKNVCFFAGLLRLCERQVMLFNWLIYFLHMKSVVRIFIFSDFFFKFTIIMFEQHNTII